MKHSFGAGDPESSGGAELARVLGLRGSQQSAHELWERWGSVCAMHPLGDLLRLAFSVTSRLCFSALATLERPVPSGTLCCQPLPSCLRGGDFTTGTRTQKD